MSFPILLAVLGAALLHASWNAIIKTGGDNRTGMLLLSIGHALIGALVAATRPFPAVEAWPWIAGSGLIHMGYQLFLAYAYDHGDLSRVYPIARGTAPLIVVIVGALLLADAVSAMEYAGIVILGLGILAMARGVFTSGESRRMLPYAFGASLATAGYSLADGIGARVSGDAVSYVGWLMMASALFYTPAAVALGGRRVFAATPRGWVMGLVAAAASYTAYAIVVWAMTQAPIALVAALRETSILFAVLIGWLFFGERLGAAKAIAATLIVAGVVLTRM